MKKFRDVSRNCFFWIFTADLIISNCTLISLCTSANLTFFLVLPFQDFVLQSGNEQFNTHESKLKIV